MSAKPCPYCGNPAIESSIYRGQFQCTEEECDNILIMPLAQWNCRPLENKLKEALDCFFKAIPIALDENFTHKMRTRRLQQSLDDARKLLGLVKAK